MDRPNRIVQQAISALESGQVIVVPKPSRIACVDLSIWITDSGGKDLNKNAITIFPALKNASGNKYFGLLETSPISHPAHLLRHYHNLLYALHGMEMFPDAGRPMFIHTPWFDPNAGVAVAMLIVLLAAGEEAQALFDHPAVREIVSLIDRVYRRELLESAGWRPGSLSPDRLEEIGEVDVSLTGSIDSPEMIFEALDMMIGDPDLPIPERMRRLYDVLLEGTGSRWITEYRARYVRAWKNAVAALRDGIVREWPGDPEFRKILESPPQIPPGNRLVAGVFLKSGDAILANPVPLNRMEVMERIAAGDAAIAFAIGAFRGLEWILFRIAPVVVTCRTGMRFGRKEGAKYVISRFSRSVPVDMLVVSRRLNRISTDTADLSTWLKLRWRGHPDAVWSSDIHPPEESMWEVLRAVLSAIGSDGGTAEGR